MTVASSSHSPSVDVLRFIESTSRGDASPDPATSDASFNELALRVFAFQFENNVPYRRFCEGRRARPDTVTNWRDIPAMPTVGFKELDLSCVPASDRARVFHSSGTTAHKPGRHAHSAESLALYHAALLPPFARHLVSPIPAEQPPMLFLVPSPEAAPHSSLAEMLAVAGSRFGGVSTCFACEVHPDGSWVLDANQCVDWFERRTALNEACLVAGTAFSFVQLLDQLAAGSRRFELPAGSTAMETGGYKGRSRELPKAGLHALISERLGVAPGRIVCEYGMSELGSQAYDRVAGATDESRCFHFPHWVRTRIVSPESGDEVAGGESGLLQIFDPVNAFSVMAVQTEDLVRKVGGGFELIGRAPAAEPRGCSLMPAAFESSPSSSTAA